MQYTLWNMPMTHLSIFKYVQSFDALLILRGFTKILSNLFRILKTSPDRFATLSNPSKKTLGDKLPTFRFYGPFKDCQTQFKTCYDSAKLI